MRTVRGELASVCCAAGPEVNGLLLPDAPAPAGFQHPADKLFSALRPAGLAGRVFQDCTADQGESGTPKLCGRELHGVLLPADVLVLGYEAAILRGDGAVLWPPV